MTYNKIDMVTKDLFIGNLQIKMSKLHINKAKKEISYSEVIFPHVDVILNQQVKISNRNLTGKQQII